MVAKIGIFILQQIFWNQKNPHKISYNIPSEQKFEKNNKVVTKKGFKSAE